MPEKKNFVHSGKIIIFLKGPLLTQTYPAAHMAPPKALPSWSGRWAVFWWAMKHAPLYSAIFLVHMHKSSMTAMCSLFAFHICHYSEVYSKNMFIYA